MKFIGFRRHHLGFDAIVSELLRQPSCPNTSLTPTTVSTSCAPCSKAIPVFYDVSPSVLRCEADDGPYTKAFLKFHGRRSASEVKKWKDALRMAAELNGFKLDDYNG
jgi:hypothetical protein